LPQTCPCVPVVGDLSPNTSYVAALYDASGGVPIQMLNLSTGPEGVLSFAAPASARQVTLTAGGKITDTTPPTVTLTSPQGGAVVSGVITLAAMASDVGTGVTRVQFLVDGAQVDDDLAAPYAFAFDTTTVTDGAHAFAARAFDGAGHVTTSDAV